MAGLVETVLPFVLGPLTAWVTILISRQFAASDAQKKRDRGAHRAVQRYVEELQLRSEYAWGAVSSYDDYDGTEGMIARPKSGDLSASFLEARRFFDRLYINDDEKRHFSLEGPLPNKDAAQQALEYDQRADVTGRVLARGLRPEAPPKLKYRSRFGRKAERQND